MFRDRIESPEIHSIHAVSCICYKQTCKKQYSHQAYFSVYQRSHSLPMMSSPESFHILPFQFYMDVISKSSINTQNPYGRVSGGFSCKNLLLLRPPAVSAAAWVAYGRIFKAFSAKTYHRQQNQVSTSASLPVDPMITLIIVGFSEIIAQNSTIRPEIIRIGTTSGRTE